MHKKLLPWVAENLDVQGNADFPIVGIGASAGGLEALEAFLKALPEKPDMAFVIVQHLDPHHKGLLTEILATTTSMTVRQIEDGMPVELNTVYVVPPNKNLSIHHRVLYLLDFIKPHGSGIPIDTFFKSLALDQEARSIGIILSGMGRDGTEGLKAIKENAGLCFVQDPASAKFDGMPKSAIQSGVADIIAPAEGLSEQVIACIKNRPLDNASHHAEKETDSAKHMQKIILLLRRRSGQDFSDYKINTLARRVERRIGLHKLDSLAKYVRLLQEMPQELDLLQRELLIGVTSFFRDPLVWEKLSETLFPAWFEGGTDPRCFRVWIAGCSTGEDAYSLAMLFREALNTYNPSNMYTLQIFASDLNQDAIDQAREGIFPPSIRDTVSEERLNAFFDPLPHGGMQIKKEIREMIIFAKQNILMDPPFTKIDLLICRNLLIYLTQRAQEKLLPIFHFSLNPAGILFLGSAETVGNQRQLFEPIDKTSRIFRKTPFGLRSDQLNFPTFMRSEHLFSSSGPEMQKEQNLQTLTEKLILNVVSPPSVMVNKEGDILYVSGRTGKYLEPAAGKANWNIFAMAHDSLKYPINSAFEECLRLKKNITRKNLRIESPQSDYFIDLSLIPILKPSPLAGLILVVFKDIETLPPAAQTGTAPLPPEQSRITLLENELTQTRVELKHTREEMQTSEEESKSINEELQSINEELTTSREEIQSMNEELQTLNAELQRKLDDLSLLNNDLSNLLNRTEIATLFLDSDLKIRLFTAGVTKILNLIPSDVGRNISDIALKLQYPRLREDAEEVLHTLLFHEEQACDAAGNWYLIRILPYRTVHNLIDGAVITFTDITAAKELESHLRDKIASQNHPPTP